MITAPYGSWPSPITPDAIVADSVRLGDVAVTNSAVYWVEGRPSEKGRMALVRHSNGGVAEDVLSSQFSVRTRVHEYGGLAFTVADDVVWFCNDEDGRIYVASPGIEPSPVSPEGDDRYAEPVVDVARQRLYCIRERAGEGTEPVNELVMINLKTHAVSVLAQGHDFYACPRPHADGTSIAFISWDHPQMPWDGTDLWLLALDEQGNVGALTHVAGGQNESVVQPEWSPSGALFFVSDTTGWWNLYQRDVGGAVHAVCPMRAEFGKPHWVFGLTTYGFTADGRIGCAYSSDGVACLAMVDPASGECFDVPSPFTSFEHVRVNNQQLVAVVGSPDASSRVASFSLPDGSYQIHRESSALVVPVGFLSRPQSIWFDSAPDRVHAFYYPPASETHTAPRGELPPLVVIGHGGPTSATSAVLDARVQFWTSRGFAVVDVNYRGSTGFGRPYRDALKTQWGVVDVADCVNAAQHLAGTQLADPKRLIIRGGSAGGFTALAALCFHDVFAVAASYYGISELESLATDTHKFESRYLDSLIGPYPQTRSRYRERSPIHHVDQLSCPAIFFQGLEDKVVPPNQAQMMVAALKAKNLAVEYHAFEGEQHGFRQAETIKQTLRSELGFYGRVLGFEPAPC
jgi:dipeptidyl aminopeptidase/acylaminoacyl peptidase